MDTATPHPPVRWEIGAAVLLVLAAASALLGLAGVAFDLNLLEYVASRGRSGISALFDLLVRYTLAFVVLDLLVVVGQRRRVRPHHGPQRRDDQRRGALVGAGVPPGRRLDHPAPGTAGNRHAAHLRPPGRRPGLRRRAGRPYTRRAGFAGWGRTGRDRLNRRFDNLSTADETQLRPRSGARYGHPATIYGEMSMNWVSSPSPRRWEGGTIALIVLTGATALYTMVLLLIDLTTLTLALAGGPAAGFAVLSATLSAVPGFDWIYLGVWVAFVVGWIWWRRATLALVESFGVDEDDAKRTTRTWAIRIGNGIVLVDIVLDAFDFIGRPRDFPPHPTMPQIATESARVAAHNGLIMLALAFILLGIVLGRRQVHRLMAESTFRWAFPVAPGGVPADPPVLGLPGAAGPSSPAAPAADDVFWERVRALSVERNGDLALLETVATGERRWLIVPARDPLGVRAAIAPSSVIVVYSEPPRPGAEAPKKPPAAAGIEWYGLLENAGSTRFQLLLPTRVPDWLAEARKATRFGLYRANDPDALTATMPASAARPEPEPA